MHEISALLITLIDDFCGSSDALRLQGLFKVRSRRKSLVKNVQQDICIFCKSVDFAVILYDCLDEGVRKIAIDLPLGPD